MKESKTPKFKPGDNVIEKVSGRRLTISRRQHEYDHQYGITLTGTAKGKNMIACTLEENGVVKEIILSVDELELEKK